MLQSILTNIVSISLSPQYDSLSKLNPHLHTQHDIEPSKAIFQAVHSTSFMHKTNVDEISRLILTTSQLGRHAISRFL